MNVTPYSRYSCRTCTYPIRHPGCHSTCELYKKEKASADELSQKIAMDKTNKYRPSMTSKEYMRYI